MKLSKSTFTPLFLVVLILGSSVTVAAAATTIDDPSKVNFESDNVQNPKIPVTVDKQYHEVGWAPEEYEGNSGDVVTADGGINESSANPVTLTATDIQFADAGAFPHENDSLSALHADEWSKAGANASKLTVSNTTTASNVEAVRFSTSSMTSGDVANATYTHSIDSDEAKRHIQLFADVSTLEASTHVEVRIVDEDGDYKTVLIDPDNSTDSANVLANSTGEGQVTQQQLGELPTTTVSGSDGTFDNIEKLVIHVEDGNFDGSFSVINAEKMSPYTLGEQAYDGSDDDSEKDETRTITEPSGAYDVKSVDTLGSTFDNAVVHGATFDMKFRASDIEQSSDLQIEFTDDRGEDGAYPSFDWVVDSYYRLELPSAYDLSYSNAKLTDTVEMPGSRYQTVEYAEGVGDTEFSEISSWSSVSSSYESQGSNVTLDSTIQPGQQIAIHYEYVVTKNEKKSIASSGAVPGQFDKESGGGIWGFLTSLPGIGAVISVVGALIGGKMALGK